MKASIIFFPNEAKKSKRTGRIPDYMRICFRTAKAEGRLNAEIAEKDLLKWDPRTMRLVERNSQVNHQLNRLDQKFMEFFLKCKRIVPDQRSSDQGLRVRNK